MTTNEKIVAGLSAAVLIGGLIWVMKAVGDPTPEPRGKNLKGIKKPTGSVTSKDNARKIASDWHSGSSSPLYSFSSSGEYRNEKYADYMEEVEEGFADARTSSQRSALKKLKKWFAYKHWEASK